MIGKSKERMTDIHKTKFARIVRLGENESAEVFFVERAMTSISCICTFFGQVRRDEDEGLVVAHLISRLEM